MINKTKTAQKSFHINKNGDKLINNVSDFLIKYDCTILKTAKLGQNS